MKAKHIYITLVTVLAYSLSIYTIHGLFYKSAQSEPRPALQPATRVEISYTQSYTDRTEIAIMVTATNYHATPQQTDSTPHITAGNYVIDPTNPDKHRYIAISRDLLQNFPMGSKVLLTGFKNQNDNGIYLIADKMNTRYSKRIDVLTNEQRRLKAKNITMTKI